MGVNMRKKVIIFSALLFSGTIMATPALAGGWGRGLGETVTEATDNATKNAAAIVRSRGEGCVGLAPGSNPDDLVRVVGKDQHGLWIVEVAYSNHNGSCGKMSRDQLMGIAFAKDIVRSSGEVFGK